MSPNLRLAVLTAALLLCAREVGAQPPPEPPAEAPPKVYSPNPPGCAADIAKAVQDLVDFAVTVVFDTEVCSQMLGWYGQTIFGNKANWPFHDAKRCAANVLWQFSYIGDFLSNIFGLSLDCFNDNQGCGVSISQTIKALSEAAAALVQASSFCEKPGTAPYFSNRDIPINGFRCWQTVWHVVQRIVKATKFIDVATTVCENPNHHQWEEEEEEAPQDTNDTLGANRMKEAWAALQQPQPFAMQGVADSPPAERRLTEEEAWGLPLSDFDVAGSWLELEQLRDQVLWSASQLRLQHAVSDLETEVAAGP